MLNVNPSGQQSPFDRFNERIAPYKEAVDVWRASSLDPCIREQLGKRQLAFAFVDGLHTYYAALQDIGSVSHTSGIIAVDDISYGFQIMLAFRRASHLFGRIAVHQSPCKEGYLLPAGLGYP